MTEERSKRQVTVARTGDGRFTATNARGGTVSIGTGVDAGIQPG